MAYREVGMQRGGDVSYREVGMWLVERWGCGL